MKTKLTHEERVERAEKLSEIKDKLAALYQECDDVLRGTGIIRDRAKAYWLSALESMIEGCNRYDHTIGETIKELDGTDEDNEDE